MRARVWPVVFLCLLLTLPAFSQKFTGIIRGAVTDQSGAVVPGAEVTIKNDATGETRTVTTNDQGEYVAPELMAGVYTVTIKKANFKESVSKGVELHVASTAVANTVLEVGNVSEQMTIEANNVQVETTTGAVGNVVEGNEVRELPLNGRSFAQLTQLMPGVSPQANFDSKNKGLLAGVDFSVNGNSTTGNIFTVDGVNNNDIGSNRTILVYPSVDAIQEFKILRNSYGPEYGQAMGAVVNIITRGGTNQFHGGVFYFGRNDVLNATDYFNNLHGTPKDVLRRNDFGYNLGGPIIKDKLFFFWSQEWNRELRGAERSANVPTPAERAGDFSVLRAGCEEPPKNPLTGADMTQVPADEFSPVGLALMQIYPDPNIPADRVQSDCVNWAQSLTAPIYWRQENIRADYRLGSSWTVFGRYTQDHWSQPFPSTLGFWGDDPFPSVESSWIQPGYQATIKVTKLFGNSAVNDFQVSYAANRITADRAGTNPQVNDQIAQIFQPNFPLSDKQAGSNIGYPIFWGGLGDGASDDLWAQAPWHNNEALYILKDDFSKVHGNHTFKVGFLFSNNQKNELVNGASGENTQFGGVVGLDPDNPDSGDSTKNGVFDALWAGRVWDSSELQTNPFSQTRWHDIEFYYGDNWKLSRRLTLDYGFRWSFLRQGYHSKNKIATFEPSAYDPALGSDPCNGLWLVPGTNFCQEAGFLGGVPGPNRALKENNNHAIAPRIGIAYDLRGDGKTSIRAGIGQFFQRERLNHTLNMANNAPFSLTANGVHRTLDTPVSQSGSGAPGFGIDPGSDLPNTWQWNLTVEHEILRNTLIELAYVGNRGLHLLRYNDINAVPPALRLQHVFSDDGNTERPFGDGGFGFIPFGEWKGASSYHSLQALFRTRMKGFDAQFAYTYSKSLSDADIVSSGSSGQTQNLVDPTNPRLNYGPTTINRPHNFVANIVYNVPDFRGHNAVVRHALGGWELASILDYASGTPLTVFANQPDIEGAPQGLTGTGVGQGETRPNRVFSQPCRAPSGSPKFQWLNPNAWTIDGYQLATFGNASIGDCSGPGIANTDFSIYKNFKIKEKVTVQFRMEFFNLFNKVQFRGNSPDLTGIDSNLTQDGTACIPSNVGDSDSPCFGRPLNTVSWNFAANGNNTFGQAQSDKGPREIQYALKITF